MDLLNRYFTTYLALLAAVFLAGCSGGADLLKAPTGLVTSTIDSLKTAKLPSLPVADPEPVGAPTELYTRIARGATLCWFGPHGVLKATHIFNGQADPPSLGGRAEIVIHEKDLSMPNPRGNRAFRVAITPVGESSQLEIENIRFDTETGKTMTADVRRWARNDLSCTAATKVEGWKADSLPPDPPVGGPTPKPHERRI